MPPVPPIKRAVLYARVSSDDRDNDGRNLKGQLAMGREHCQHRGYQIVAELAEDDRGASGAEIDLPKLSQIREMARAGEFDVLVVREIDRLSRSLAKQLIVEEELKRTGVQIEYVLGEYTDTPEGQLQKHIKAVIAEYERAKITERMERGKRLKVKAGSVMLHGHVPLGYRMVELDGLHRLEIYEPDAKIVRLIFQWYVNGDGNTGPLSSNDIGIRLGWTRGRVIRTLRNETYAGRWYYGKRSIHHDATIPVEVPAIVSRDLWARAQRRLQQNRKQARRNRKHDYLLSLRVICGQCRGPMTGEKSTAHRRNGKKDVYYYYLCQRGRHDPSVHFRKMCPAPRFPANQVDCLVWRQIHRLLTDPSEIERLIDNQRNQAPGADQAIRDRLEAVAELIRQNHAQLDRLLGLYLVGNFKRDKLLEHQARIETAIRKLETEYNDLAQRLERTANLEQAHQLLAEARAGLEKATTFARRRALIELLDVQVDLLLINGERYIRTHCNLIPVALREIRVTDCEA